MSRVGLKPIQIPSGCVLKLEGQKISITGPKGQLTLMIPESLVVHTEGETVSLSTKINAAKAIHGLTRTLLANAISGVTNHWTKTLELVGVGFRAEIKGTDLILNMGFSHPVVIVAPPGIIFTVAENKVIVSGADKQLVGGMAAITRRVKPPEPYKGKGIRYLGEKIRKKAGKAAKALGGAPGAK